MDDETTQPDGEETRKEICRKVESILSLVDEWRVLWYHADRRYQELLRHFNGGDLEVMTDKDGNEVAHYANFNVARSRLLKISRERMQPYYSKLGILDVKITKPELKSLPGLELACNEAISKIFRADMRMTPHYQSVVQDAILTGRGVLWRRSPSQIIMEQGRLLAHPDCMAAQRDDSFADWAFEGTVKASELFRIGKSSGNAEIKEQAGRLLKAIVDRNSSEATPLNWPTEEIPWESFDSTLRTTSAGRKALNTVIPCYWYFEKDLSGAPGKRPVSVYCVARHGVDLSIIADDKGKVSSSSKKNVNYAEGMIYMKEKAFKESGECAWLFTIGEQFGGKPTLGRIKGEGEIQYSADIRIQKMLNSMLRRIEVENLTLFKNTGAASNKDLDNLAANPLKEHDVIPDGIEFIERRFGDKPLNGMMQFIGLLSGYAADHASVDTGHTDAPREENFKDQVLERLNDRVAAKTITESAWSDCLDQMARTIGYLIFDATLIEADEAYEFREAFLEELKDAGFDKLKMSDLKGGVKVTARRNPGHGDMGVAMARADANIGLAQMVGPEAVQRAVFEKAVLVAGGDVQKAAELLGRSGEPAQAPPDTHNAQSQIAVILATGIAMAAQPNDNPYIHTVVQMTLLETALSGYQNEGGWTAKDMRCWDAALAHAIQDIIRIPDQKVQKESIGRIKELQATASAVTVFEQGAPAVDPIAQAKIQLAAEELARKKQKDASADQKWSITQAHREERDADMLALQQHSMISANSRLDKEASGKQASRQLSDALAINEATKPEPESDAA